MSDKTKIPMCGGLDEARALVAKTDHMTKGRLLQALAEQLKESHPRLLEIRLGSVGYHSSAYGLGDLQELVRAMAEEKGWAKGERTPDWIAARLALVHLEVSEAVECVREGRMLDLPEELADVVLRALCISSALGIDLSSAVMQKLAKNAGRTWDHVESGLT